MTSTSNADKFSSCDNEVNRESDNESDSEGCFESSSDIDCDSGHFHDSSNCDSESNFESESDIESGDDDDTEVKTEPNSDVNDSGVVIEVKSEPESEVSDDDNIDRDNPERIRNFDQWLKDSCEHEIKSEPCEVKEEIPEEPNPEASSSHTDLDVLQNLLEKHKLEKREAQLENEELKRQLAKCTADRAETQEELERLKSENMQLKMDSEMVNKQNCQQATTIKNLKLVVTECKENGDHLELKVKGLTKEMENHEAWRAGMLEESDALKKHTNLQLLTINKMKLDVARCRSDRDNLEAKVGRLEVERARQELEVSGLKRERTLLEEELKSCKDGRRALELDIDQHREEVLSYMHRVAERISDKGPHTNGAESCSPMAKRARKDL